MNTSVESYQAWEALLKAYDDHCALSDISFAVRSLHGHMEGTDAAIESPISDGLQALIARTKELSDDFERYEVEIESSYQGAAWGFAAIGYGIHAGERIEFTDWRGRVVVGSAHELWVRERTAGELTLRVLLLRKDGSVGKKDGHMQLAHDGWRNLDSDKRDRMPNTALEPTGVGAGSSASRSTSLAASGSALDR
jgi:hypothetical protein